MLKSKYFKKLSFWKKVTYPCLVWRESFAIWCWNHLSFDDDLQDCATCRYNKGKFCRRVHVPLPEELYWDCNYWDPKGNIIWLWLADLFSVRI